MECVAVTEDNKSIVADEVVWEDADNSTLLEFSPSSIRQRVIMIATPEA